MWRTVRLRQSQLAEAGRTIVGLFQWTPIER